MLGLLPWKQDRHIFYTLITFVVIHCSDFHGKNKGAWLHWLDMHFWGFSGSYLASYTKTIQVNMSYQYHDKLV